jgi:hypothetical protein
MQSTYEGTLKDDHIEWNREAPPSGQKFQVWVTVMDQKKGLKEQRGQRMTQALNNLAESGAFGEVEDPVKWQRDIRTDRPLPNREE